TVGTVTVAGSYSSFSGRNVEITVPQSGATNTTTFPNGMYIWKAYHGDRAILRRAGIQEGAVHQWYPSVRFNNLGSSWQSFRYVLEYKICNCAFAQDRSYQANYRVRFNGNNFEMQSTYTNIYLPHNAASGWNHSAAYIRLQARIFQ